MNMDDINLGNASDWESDFDDEETDGDIDIGTVSDWESDFDDETTDGDIDIGPESDWDSDFNEEENHGNINIVNRSDENINMADRRDEDIKNADQNNMDNDSKPFFDPDILIDHRNDQCYQPYMRIYQLPSGQIFMPKLIRLLYERITVLACIDRLDQSASLSVEQKKAIFLSILQKYGLNLYVRWFTKEFSGTRPGEEGELNEQDRDYNISYTFLQAIAASDKNLLAWICRNETRLVIWKCSDYDSQNLTMGFLRANGIGFEEVSLTEKRSLKEKLAAYLHDDHDPSRVENIRFFKVPWQTAHKIIAEGEAFLCQGICYVPEQNMGKIIPTLSHDHMKHAQDSGFLDSIQANILGRGRSIYLYKYIESAQKQIMHQTRSLGLDILQIEARISSFPPCIRYQIEQLEKLYHLKHESRNQLAVFLKCCGADPDLTIDYIKRLFLKSPNCDEAKWNRDYDYFFHHRFGLRGSRIDYTVRPCSVNISLHESANSESAGCPFAVRNNADIEDLGKKFSNWQVPERDKPAIFGYINSKQCTEACQALFTSLHGVNPDKHIRNPLDYYEQSLNHQMLTSSRSEDIESEVARIESLFTKDSLLASLKSQYIKSSRCQEYCMKGSILRRMIHSEENVEPIIENKNRLTVKFNLQEMKNYLIEEGKAMKNFNITN